ncbi:unnamed protein product [Amoebophrya sp. A120]|nr:unnamed protein product [Amoebophrya sp. A120]|eukprot:GSA120T00025859001.1
MGIHQDALEAVTRAGHHVTYVVVGRDSEAVAKKLGQAVTGEVRRGLHAKDPDHAQGFGYDYGPREGDAIRVTGSRFGGGFTIKHSRELLFSDVEPGPSCYLFLDGDDINFTSAAMLAFLGARPNNASGGNDGTAPPPSRLPPPAPRGPSANNSAAAPRPHPPPAPVRGLPSRGAPMDGAAQVAKVAVPQKKKEKPETLLDGAAQVAKVAVPQKKKKETLLPSLSEEDESGDRRIPAPEAQRPRRSKTTPVRGPAAPLPKSVARPSSKKAAAAREVNELEFETKSGKKLSGQDMLRTYTRKEDNRKSKDIILLKLPQGNHKDKTTKKQREAAARNGRAWRELVDKARVAGGEVLLRLKRLFASGGDKSISLAQLRSNRAATYQAPRKNSKNKIEHANCVFRRRVLQTHRLFPRAAGDTTPAAEAYDAEKESEDSRAATPSVEAAAPNARGVELAGAAVDAEEVDDVAADSQEEGYYEGDVEDGDMMDVEGNLDDVEEGYYEEENVLSDENDLDDVEEGHEEENAFGAELEEDEQEEAELGYEAEVEEEQDDEVEAPFHAAPIKKEFSEEFST